MPFLNQIDFKKTFDFNRIFEITPDAQGLYVYLSIVFALFILSAIVLGWRAMKTEGYSKKIYKNFFRLFFTTGLIGLALIFLRFEGVAYLGSRFLLWVLFFAFLVWLTMILRYILFVLPPHLKEIAEQQNFEKYLPKKQKST